MHDWREEPVTLGFLAHDYVVHRSGFTCGKLASDPYAPDARDDRPVAIVEHKEAQRYPGRNPRAFHHKYKELNPERYAGEAEKVMASGKTPAGTHRPIMVAEVLACLQPAPAKWPWTARSAAAGMRRRFSNSLQPGGRLIGLDVDPIELPRTEARLRAAGFGPDTFIARPGNFAGLPRALAEQGLAAADIVIADLGVSSMQLDDPVRGFTYKEPGRSTCA